MSDEVKGWRALPTALLAAIVIEVGSHIVLQLCTQLAGAERFAGAWSMRISLASSAVALTSFTLASYGTFELAQRFAGRAAIGARLAGWGFTTGLALMVGFHVDLWPKVWEHHWLFEALPYAWLVITLMIVTGFVLATDGRQRSLVIAAAVVAIVIPPLPVIEPKLQDALGIGYHGYLFLESIRGVIEWIAYGVLATIAVVGGATAVPSLATSGLRRAADALRLRVYAALAVTMLTLMIGLSSRGGGIEILKVAMIAGAAINILTLVMFAFGTLAAARSTLADLPRVPLVIAGALSLFCGGLALAQLPVLYRTLFGEGSGFGGFGAESIETWSVAGPLVGIASIALVSGSISAFAARRSLDDLRMNASSRGFGFVVLMLASLAIQNWVVPRSQSLGTLVFMMIVAAVASLWGTLLMAGSCNRAADQLETEPGLPTATVVSGLT